METLAQLLIGLLFIALFVNLMKGGTPAVKAWWNAKFLGQTG